MRVTNPSKPSINRARQYHVSANSKFIRRVVAPAAAIRYPSWRSVGRSRIKYPRDTNTRKVRAPQEMLPGNAWEQLRVVTESATEKKPPREG